MTNSPVQYQGIPPVNTPVMNPDGTMTLPWYRFFTSLFYRSGLNTPAGFGISAPAALDGTGVQFVYPQFYATDPSSGATKVLIMRDQTKGTLIGLIGYTP